MSYYSQLIGQMEKSMRKHPCSTLVMDSSTFKIIASGKDASKVSRQVKRQKASPSVSVVFQQIKPNAVWILTGFHS
jgi:hypothetical protein